MAAVKERDRSVCLDAPCRTADMGLTSSQDVLLLNDVPDAYYSQTFALLTYVCGCASYKEAARVAREEADLTAKKVASRLSLRIHSELCGTDMWSSVPGG
eukprot:1614021-Rhodomonas_salina.5